MEFNQARVEAALRSGGISHHMIYKAALQAALEAKADPQTILDFGSGIGEFLGPLGATFPKASISAVDIMAAPSTLPAGIRWEQVDLNQNTPFADQSFDLIFSIEVIEHLENPRHVMREFYRLLKPGGVLVLTTPNTESIRSILQVAVRGHFAQFDDSNYPAHITAVSPVDLKRIASETGFASCNFFHTNQGALPKLLKWKWQQVPVIGPYFKGARFSDNYGAVLRRG